MIKALQKNLDTRLQINKKKRRKKLKFVDKESPFAFNYENEALNSRLSILVERFANRAVEELDSNNVFKRKKIKYAE